MNTNFTHPTQFKEPQKCPRRMKLQAPVFLECLDDKHLLKSKFTHCDSSASSKERPKGKKDDNHPNIQISGNTIILTYKLNRLQKIFF